MFRNLPSQAQQLILDSASLVKFHRRVVAREPAHVTALAAISAPSPSRAIFESMTVVV